MPVETILDSAMEILFDRVGQSATFTPAVGDPVTCSVDLVTGVELQPDGYSSQAFELGNTIEGRTAELGLGRDPNKGETFTINSNVYTVAAVLESDGRIYKVVVK